ncbi:MAG: prolyl oligopeptidase family serine peptidase [Elusimicrobia bacterium]|nr:prolyl oligopeptidase family serine peptidase [Elusimicrobiota bacterium]
MKKFSPLLFLFFLFFLVAGSAFPEKIGLRDFDEKQPFSAQQEILREQPAFQVYQVRFPSPVRTRFPSNNTVWGKWYLPKSDLPLPGVLVLTVLGAPNTWIEDRIAKSLLRHRLAVLVLEHPFHFHRRPNPWAQPGEMFLTRTPQGLASNFRQAIWDARQAITWMSRQKEIDPHRLGILGTSLGAIVAASTISTDSRLRCAVLLLGGADFSELLWNSAVTGPPLQKLGYSQEVLKLAWKELDPLYYKENNAGKRVLLVNALWDRVVPRPNAVKLREAFPDSRQVWVPFGHYSSILHLIWLPRYISRYFEREFGIIR